MIQDYNVYHLSKSEKIFLICGIVFISAGIGILYINSFYLALLSPLIYKIVSPKYSALMMEKRKKNIRNEFKELLYSFSASLSVSNSMEKAMKEGCYKLEEILDENSIMLNELRVMNLSIDTTGSDASKLWHDLADRCKLEDFQLFADVYGACMSSGGNLISAIDSAAKTICEKIETENNIKRLANQKVLEGRIIAVIPIIIIIFLRLSSPGYIGPMYSGLGGNLIMLTAFLISAAAIVLTERITKIEV